jgi:RNA polymerase sigma-70 factor (ECF subfamily)
MNTATEYTISMLPEEKSLSDYELVQLCLQNKESFGLIIDRFIEPLRRYIRRRTNASGEDVDDIIQESFIKVYKNLYDFDSGLSLSSWVYRIAHNTTIDWYRKNKRHMHVSIDDENVEPLLRDLTGANQYNHYLDRNMIQVALVELPEPARTIIILRYFEEKSYQEISDILRIPVNAVGIKISRAKKLLTPLITKNL